MKPWQQTLLDFANNQKNWVEPAAQPKSQKATELFVKALYYWTQGNPVWSALIGKANQARLVAPQIPLLTLDPSGSPDNEQLYEGIRQLMSLPETEIN